MSKVDLDSNRLRTREEQDLTRLKTRTLDMGALAESMAIDASHAIVNPEATVIEQVFTNEATLDAMQKEIDREAIRLMTVYSPAARDLRFLLMIVRINTELERIGDQAVNICEYVQLLQAHSSSRPLPELQEMSALALGMLHDARRAFENEDGAIARAVIDGDDALDVMNARVMTDILDQRCVDQETVTGCISALVARSLERIGDYATNICEEVLYVVSGEDVRHLS